MPAVKGREIIIPIGSGKIINLVGAKRTGKTYLLLSMIKKLREDVPNNRIVYKDIFERHRVSNIHLKKYLIKFLFSNSSNLISINKIYNELISFGLKVSINSVYKYISYLEDSYNLFN